MEIEIKEALKRRDLAFIDLRSPLEHAACLIPGSINVPLLNNAERHEVGLVYHKEGELAARKTGLDLVTPRLTALVETVLSHAGSNTPLLYCARGGGRSQSLERLMETKGHRVFRLKGGYRAYRRHVNSELANFTFKAKLIVLHGLTGVGKTALLKELGSQGLPVIDLEYLARHKGSVFGAIGAGTPRSQKDFDALLLLVLEHLKDFPVLFIEGEGKRIGNIYLPDFLTKAMAGGYQVLLTAPLPTRVERILAAYRPDEFSGRQQAESKEAAWSLNQRLGLKKINTLLSALERQDYRTAVKMLCTDYYDHYYEDSRIESADFDEIIDASDLLEAAGVLGRTFKEVCRRKTEKVLK